MGIVNQVGPEGGGARMTLNTSNEKEHPDHGDHLQVGVGD